MAIIGADIPRIVSYKKKRANNFQRAKEIIDVYESGGYYVYRHIRKDKNEPFYIGIGRQKKYIRAKATATQRNKIWNHIVNKTDWDWEILFENLSLKEACEKEKEFIQLYGRIDTKTGTLANMTDGGEGITGYSHKSETKKKIKNNNAKYWKGKKRPIVGKKVSKALKGRKGKLCPNSKKIVGLSPEGKIYTFHGQADAVRILSEKTGKKFHQAAISNCCREKSKSHNGWKFKRIDSSTNFKSMIPRGGKPVKVTVLKTDEVKTFETITDACHHYGKVLNKKINISTASAVIKGLRNHHHGLKFEFI